MKSIQQYSILSCCGPAIAQATWMKRDTKLIHVHETKKFATAASRVQLTMVGQRDAHLKF